jgi:hypothetical protein
MSVKAIVFQQRRKRGARQRLFASLAPSAWWIQEIGAGRVKTFPPRADHCRMVRCRSRHKQCQRFYPRYYVRDCDCEDCHQARLLAQEQAWEREQRRRPDGTLEDEDAPTLAAEHVPPLTPHAEALVELREQHGELPETLKEPLASEDEADLRAEIEASRASQINKGEECLSQEQTRGEAQSKGRACAEET